MASEFEEFSDVRDVLQGRYIHGLYIHIPFCVRRCCYCDFYSVVDPALHGPFVEALAAEMRHRDDQTKLSPGTIYVGGGTPTVLAPTLWRRLIGEIDLLRTRCDVREFTVEANPETVNAEIVAVLVDGGVDRLSIGAQSACPTLLATLGRRHTPDSVERAVDIARQAGIGNVSLDYIFGIPGQTIAMLDADIDAALTMVPQHLSFYGLTYEPGTELARQVDGHTVRPVLPELERQMYEHLMHRLEAAGYEHYEISNWALSTPPIDGEYVDDGSAWRCRHNLAYWRNVNWLGAGPGAASHVEGFRWKNQPDLKRYIQQPDNPPTTDHERLDESRRVGEQLMLGLRMRQGVLLDWLVSHLHADDDRWQAIDELIGLGMLERTETHLRLTHQGVFVADTVIAKLL